MTTFSVTRMRPRTDGSTRGVVHRVRVTGELDLATATTVDAALRSALATRPTTLVIDLSGVTFCDSRGLRPLEEAQLSGRHLGVTVTLTGMPACIDHLRTLLPSRMQPA